MSVARRELRIDISEAVMIPLPIKIGCEGTFFIIEGALSQLFAMNPRYGIMIQQFILRWNDYCLSFSNICRRLLDDRDILTVSLLVLLSNIFHRCPCFVCLHI